MSKSVQPVLIIHGGAGHKALSKIKAETYQASLERILMAAFQNLLMGQSALTAVTSAAALLEDDPLYNAGLGSKIQSDGKIRMSASLMDGSNRRFGGCINVQGIKNPIYLARKLMKDRDRVLCGAGGETRAKEFGLQMASPFTESERAEYRRKKAGKSGTIGALALDQRGHLAAATSTGGRGFEYPGRVSDSPTVAGNFANEVAAVSATGTGEEIVEFAAASTICAYVEAGWKLEKAVLKVLGKAKQSHGGFGLIALDRNGRFMARTNTSHLLWAATDGTSVYVMDKKRGIK